MGNEVSVSKIQLVTGCNYVKAKELHELIYSSADVAMSEPEPAKAERMPCPFCGGILPEHEDGCYIKVLSKALMEGVLTGDVSKETAAALDAAWNVRISDTGAAYEESNCQDDLMALSSEIGDWLYFMVETDPGHVIVADDMELARDFRVRLAKLGVDGVE